MARASDGALTLVARLIDEGRLVRPFQRAPPRPKRCAFGSTPPLRKRQCCGPGAGGICCASASCKSRWRDHVAQTPIRRDNEMRKRKQPWLGSRKTVEIWK